MDGPAKTTGLLQTLLLILCLCVVINRAQRPYSSTNQGQNNNYNLQQHALSTNNNWHDQQNVSPNIQPGARQPNTHHGSNHQGTQHNQNFGIGVGQPNTYETKYNRGSYQQGTQHNQNSGIGDPNGYQIPNQSNNYDQAGENQFRPVLQPQRHICRLQRTNYDCILRDVIVEYGNVEHLFGNPQNSHLKRSITLSSSRMDYLPKSLIDAFPNMETLNANSLKIRSIQPQAFEKASKLQNLYLSDNLIERIEANSLQGASSIVALVLFRNRINHIDQYALDGMQNLKHLFLHNNRITSLPFFDYNSLLEILNVSHNAINRVEDNQFYYNSQLRILDLSFNQLYYFNMLQLDSNTNLQTVFVSSNQLRQLIIPSHVKTLIARNNSIEQLSTNRQCLVETLDLSRNQFEQQPDLSYCFNLKHLDLSFNQLDNFNFYPMQTMNKLTHVNLQNNRLFQIEVPTQLNYPLSIRQLILSSNMLSSVFNTQSLNMLTELYLDSNELISFDFLNKHYLQKLTLAFNQWDCAVLKNVNIWKVSDRYREECTTGFNNEGVCCRSNEEPESQSLQKNMEKLRETFIHEKQNKKSVDDQCRSSFLQSINQQKIQEINNRLENITRLETSQEPLLKNISNVNRQFDQVVSEIGSLQEVKQAKTDRIKSIENEINRWRANYGIEKEGLVSGETVLKRIVNFLEGRKNVTDDVLMRRQNEVRRQKAEKQTKLNLIETTKQDIESLKQTLKKLKEDEQNAKMERNSLAAQVNKNSPSQRG